MAEIKRGRRFRMSGTRILSPSGVLVIIAATSASMILFDGAFLQAFMLWGPLLMTSVIGIVVVERNSNSPGFSCWTFIRDLPLILAFTTLILAAPLAIVLWNGAGKLVKQKGLGEFVHKSGGALADSQTWVFAQGADFIVIDLMFVAFWAAIGVLVGRRRAIAGLLFGLTVVAAHQLWIWSIYVLD